MTKFSFISIFFFYLLMILLFLYKIDFSYWIENIKEWNGVTWLSDNDVNKFKKAYEIQENIRLALIFSSSIMTVFSYIIIKNKLLKPLNIIKVIFYFSLIIFLLLVIIGSSNFIPYGPLGLIIGGSNR